MQRLRCPLGELLQNLLKHLGWVVLTTLIRFNRFTRRCYHGDGAHKGAKEMAA